MRGERIGAERSHGIDRAYGSLLARVGGDMGFVLGWQLKWRHIDTEMSSRGLGWALDRVLCVRFCP